MKKIILLSFGICLLIGCSTKNGSESSLSQGMTINGKIMPFSMELPSSVIYKKTRSDGSLYLATSTGSDLDYKKSDYAIEIYDQKNEKCGPSLTGASQLQPLKEADPSIQWGVVDILKRMKEGDSGYFPPFNIDHMKCGGSKFSYAFCVEKNGETTLICINQETDNPKQAEDILKTFRWTK